MNLKSEYGEHYYVNQVSDIKEEYCYLICRGGRDENGFYQLVLEGPAAGEKVYD